MLLILALYSAAWSAAWPCWRLPATEAAVLTLTRDFGFACFESWLTALETRSSLLLLATAMVARDLLSRCLRGDV